MLLIPLQVSEIITSKLLQGGSQFMKSTVTASDPFNPKAVN